MTKAEEFFKAEDYAQHLRDKIVDLILESCGLDPEDFEAWPCNGFKFDDYDSSFEMLDTKDDFKLTDDQLTRLWELGFDRCWLNHLNGTETYYYKKTVDPT